MIIIYWDDWMIELLQSTASRVSLMDVIFIAVSEWLQQWEMHCILNTKQSCHNTTSEGYIEPAAGE